MEITAKAIVTLIAFVISIAFVIRPLSFSLPIRLPVKGFKLKHIPINTMIVVPIFAIAILWAAQCLGATEIRLGIVGTDGVKPYNILILFFSLAYMAITLDTTGVLEAAAYWVSNKGGSSGWRLFVYFYIMLTVLSVVLGNDPVILSGTPFLVYYTSARRLDPKAWLMAEFTAANTASMVLFVGNPTNVVICEGFRVNNVAFTAYTILPFLGCSILGFVALALQFRSQKFIRKNLKFSERLDVREALVDPVGAWVGSFLLGSCLVVIIIVSFFQIDVWKISLPFAGAKFLFDIGWDYYRYKKELAKSILTDSVEMNKIPDYTLTAEPMSRDLNPSNDMALEARTRTSHGITKTRSNTVGSDESEKTLVNLSKRFRTLHTVYPRLPFGLIPFAFSQFILIQALASHGWIDIFARWLVIVSHREMFRTIWLVGVFGVILCNFAGTNIGATILLTKVIRASSMPDHTARAAAISLAVASNIGAVGVVYSASLAGLLWEHILTQKKKRISQRQFAMYNVLPLSVMTIAGLGIVCAEMAVLYKGDM
ncbi:hypothetical protein BDQ17DRAFT_1428253 [Cyathus striatus]|nr:hypothetical protein BDQ17DRAFT_1428253 [Cyathus striatus]